MTDNNLLENMLKRAKMALEDGNFQSANYFSEQVLNIDMETSEAYLCKLLAEFQLRKKEDLAASTVPFWNSINFKHAYAFGDEEEKAFLENSVKEIYYRSAKTFMEKAETENDFRTAAVDFKKSFGYKDSEDLYNKCLDLAEEAHKDYFYRTGIAYKLQNTVTSLLAAIQTFEGIKDWTDASEQAEECKKLLEQLKAEEEKKRLKKEKKSKVIKKTVRIVALVLAVIVVLLIVTFTVIVPSVKYNKAVSLMENGKYEEAIERFTDLGEYKDSKEKIKETNYNKAVSLMKDGKYDEAISAFFKMKGYKDSGDKLRELYALTGRYETLFAGWSHTVGLKADGTVVAVGDNDFGQCDVSGWKDMYVPEKRK